MSAGDDVNTDTVLSVDAVANEAVSLIESQPSVEELEQLITGPPVVCMDDIKAGYGRMEILHRFNLRVGKAWNSPTSDMSWYRASSPWPASATKC